MVYEWDEEKNIENYKKHGIWFEEAQTIWADQNAKELYDTDHSDNEDRWIRIGVNIQKGVLIVCFCERSEGNIIRIISARHAENEEKMFYRFGVNYEN